MKRTVSLCITALLSCLLTCPALAADTLLLTPTLYPTEVNEYASGEEMRLERTYCLSPTDDPASIPVGDFDREGWHYTLLDVTRQENSKSDEKDYAETYTLNMDTKDMEKIMPQLAAERTVTTEDGYPPARCIHSCDGEFPPGAGPSASPGICPAPARACP